VARVRGCSEWGRAVPRKGLVGTAEKPGRRTLLQPKRADFGLMKRQAHSQ
jgi:hypothetical protein